MEIDREIEVFKCVDNYPSPKDVPPSLLGVWANKLGKFGHSTVSQHPKVSPSVLLSQHRSDSNLHTEFHGTLGHMTKDCVHLNDAIESTIWKDHLNQYLAQEPYPRGRSYDREARPFANQKEDRAMGKQPVRGGERCVTGRNSEWSSSNSKRKTHLKSIMSVAAPLKKFRSFPSWYFLFSKGERDVLDAESDDLPVVSVTIVTFQVKHILLDMGSSMDILVSKAFHQMGLKDSALKKTSLIYALAN
ncbi:Integrase, catalytic core [Gossypium australe]|uniref:Integrase, catalytic core n=1 Tax=Gossypium australe TaxID=47621 RepID=A0A5B6W858_9ROSI|nr:Integrase, catalytic core [Gossypium australe]